MITNTEDKFDVDYDVFSFVGRAALIGGGLYALDKSIKQGVFQRTPDNLGKFNNSYISRLTSILEKDVAATDQRIPSTIPQKKTFFNHKQEKRNIKELGVNLTENGKSTLQKLLNDSGFKGMSADLFDEIGNLQTRIKDTDIMSEFDSVRERRSHVRSGAISYELDKSGKLTTIYMDSLSGRIPISVIGKDGMVNINGNKYVSRPMFMPSGQKAGDPFGADVGFTKAIKDNYYEIAKSELSLNEFKHLFNKTLTYNGKSYSGNSPNMLNPDVIQNILGSARDNVFNPMNRLANAAVMKNSGINGHGIASASNLADSIIRLLGDKISEIDGLAETSNPNQLFRANTFYIDKDGARHSTVALNFAFLNKEQMDKFREIAKRDYKWDFGELAKEEMLANSAIMGSVGNDVRSLGIVDGQTTEASEFVLEKLVSATGLSRDDFMEKIKENGFDAFDESQRLKMRATGVNDYQKYLKEQLRESSMRKEALLLSNSSHDELRTKRRNLLHKKNALTGALRDKHHVNPRLQKKGTRFAKRLDNHYANIIKDKPRISKNPNDYELQKMAAWRGKRKTELDSINAEIKELNKVFKPKVLKSKYYNEIMGLRKSGKLGDFDQRVKEIDAVIESTKTKLGSSNLFGISTKDGSKSYINNKIRDLTINNMHIDSNGNIGFSLLQTTKVGQGVKGTDPAGEGKAVYKSASNYVSEILMKVQTELGGELTPDIEEAFSRVHVVLNREAMKAEVSDRNMYDALHSIKEKNKLDGNQDVGKLLDEFDGSAKMDADYEDLFKKLGALVDNDFTKLTGNETLAAFIKNKRISFGNTAADLGAGDLGFLAERHVGLMLGLGMDSLVEDLLSRKINTGAFTTFKRLEKVQEAIRDSSKAANVSFRDDEQKSFLNFMNQVFPSAEDQDNPDVLARRAKYLEQYTDEATQSVFVKLSEPVDGIDKIPIFTDPNLRGLIGEQIGSEGDYKKYTEIDELTKEILYHDRAKRRDPRKLKQLLENYQTATEAMRGSVRDKILKGKITKTMYGQAASGSAALAKYADNIFDAKEIAYAAPYVAAVSKKKYIDMFGQKMYDDFIASKGKLSRAWAFAMREPTEGLSGLPVNVVPADQIEGLRDLDNTRIALVSGRSNSIIGMVFGDYDGDNLSLLATQEEKATASIERLAKSNELEAKAFRLFQESKTKFQLKGVHSKSILSHSLAELRLASYHAKDLEKNFVGIASKTLEPLHGINKKLHAAGSEDYIRTEGLLHTIAENIIKGKAQSLEDLKNNKSKEILDAIVGNEGFANKSIAERTAVFRKYLDSLMIGDAADLGDRIRAGENSEEFINEVSKKLGDDRKRAEDIINGEWFKKYTDDNSVDNFMKLTGYRNKAVDEIDEVYDNIIAKGLGDYHYRLVQMGEDTQQALDDSRRMFKGLGGNLAKYALLPAAALGLMGTVFGARSSIDSEFEFSDANRQHGKSSWVGKSNPSTNMRQPTHMKPEISGNGAHGFNIDKYSAMHKTSEVRVQDDTRNFDFYDMQDKIRRGY